MRGRRSGRVALISGSAILVALVAAGLIAPLPHDPTTPFPASTLVSPNSVFWLGTDGTGLDVFSRTIAAARTDIPLGFAGALLGCVLGTPIGLIASRESLGTNVVMRAVDVFQSLPVVIIAALITTLSGGSIEGMTIGIALINIPFFIRIMRSEALSVRSRRYIEAAEAMGASAMRVTFLHVLPNVYGVLLAQLSLAIGGAVLAVAALSFLGIGLRPPTPSWGLMISAGGSTMSVGAWWTVVPPAFAIALTVLCANLISDGLHQLLAPGRSHA